MILNPDVARVLDKAAENVSEVAVMPTKFMSGGRAKGDEGFDAVTALVYSAIDLDLMDKVEIGSNAPHICEIARQVADFGGVPNADRATQDMRFELGGRSESVTDRLRRTDDLLDWARGLPTTEVANLFRWAADEFRARPANEGVYDVYGTHEIADAFNDKGIWLKSVRVIAEMRSRLEAAAGPDMAPTLTEMMAGQQVLGMIDSVFVDKSTPDPEAAIIVRREDVTPTRLAELATEVINLINELGWCQTYVFRPDSGAVSTFGALAVLLDLPPRSDYLHSRVHRLERRWAELWAVMRGVGDYLALPDISTPCSGCGERHDRDPFMTWEDEEGRTVGEVIAALTGFRDAQVALAAHDSVGPEAVDWDALMAQLSTGGSVES